MFDWDKIGERITKIIEHFQVRSQQQDRKRLRAEIAAQLLSKGPFFQTDEGAVMGADTLLLELDKLK